MTLPKTATAALSANDPSRKVAAYSSAARPIDPMAAPCARTGTGTRCSGITVNRNQNRANPPPAVTTNDARADPSSGTGTPTTARSRPTKERSDVTVLLASMVSRTRRNSPNRMPSSRAICRRNPTAPWPTSRSASSG